jgi:hypothetical protein
VSSDEGRVWSMLLVSGFGGLDLKTIGGGFTSLGLKTRADVPMRNGRHRGIRVEAKLSHEGRGGRRMKITSGWTITPSG